MTQELLIWDDGCTDNSLGIAQSAAHSQATGTYLGWVDSDDALAPTALEETAAILDTQ